ncbi:transmembrane domain-containing protein [Cryptosporidium hominis]
MINTAQLRYENSNDQVSKKESIALNWNSWYFFPEQIIDLSLVKIQDFLILDRNLMNSNDKNIYEKLKEISLKRWNMPNTGSYSITITDDVVPGHYLILILNGTKNFVNISSLVENGLVSKPIIINQRPTKEQRIVLNYPKSSRPYGFSDVIYVNYRIFNEKNEIEDAKNKASIHIYSVDPDDSSLIEPRQYFETISNEISILGLGLEKCPTYYKITAKMLEHPFHQDSSQYIWVLPKNTSPLSLSNADLLSTRQLCIRQNNKFGMFPTIIEFGILLIITVINIIGLITLGVIINKLNKKKKKK